jgi:ketopantoate reductase
MELECIAGALVELGEKLGIATPNLKAVYACTRLLGVTVAVR